MTEANDGGPASPGYYTYSPNLTQWSEGMSLRDYFASQALNYMGMIQEISMRRHGEEVKPKDIAIMCYELADAMLKAREEGQP